MNFSVLVQAAEVCIEKIQYAEKDSGTECQAFPTPCDVPKGWTPVDACTFKEGARVEPKFQVRNFASCEEMESSLLKIYERYQSRYWYPYDMIRSGIGMPMEDSKMTREGVAPAVPTSTPSPSGNGGGASEKFSETNIQVLGVDEADIAKTDGKNLYVYSEESREVRILDKTSLKLVHTIRLPENFSSVQMYLRGDRIVLIGTKYSQMGLHLSSRFYAPETKTLIAIYRMNQSSPILERYTQIDGDYRESRMIDGVLYIVSSNSLRIPPFYMTPYKNDEAGFEKSLAQIGSSFSIKRIAPEIREAQRNSRGKYIQSLRSSVSSCSDVSFVLPDDTTLDGVEFSPTFLSISSLNIENPIAKLQSTLLFGDVSQIHMSKSALYVTSVITSGNTSTCPINARCFAPSFGGTSSTLIHKYTIAPGKITYVYSKTVSGNPMNQYSMDEDANGNFRIVTQNYAWSSEGNKNTTELTILSPQGKILGGIKNIAPGENFQSARFIGTRLYLVTFEQIDPFFVIDLSSSANPKILGELKIPGYSTYLHPYDSERLIGLGYDTITNQWGGVQNGGVKIDLYNVRDVKNPKQESSLVLGDAGSSSDVLWNPRAFVWYKEKNLLLLPATIMKSAKDKNDPYRSQSGFQGLVGLSILPGSINERFRVSHITLDAKLEKEWKEECAKYSTEKKPTCQRLLDGTEYCSSSYSYVPPYCYSGSTVETYFASRIWNYNRDFITRALYIGNQYYTLSEGGVKSWSLDRPTVETASVSFTGRVFTKNMYPLPLMAR
jgi:uncharacterized secreted protein with C-terminal beta-propeller domain